jgi:hypothetical protein
MKTAVEKFHQLFSWVAGTSPAMTDEGDYINQQTP